MKTFTYRIQDENGMHARPAGKLATCAKQFVSEIRVGAGEREADAKRLLALISLGAVCGTELCFTVRGEDEDEAVKILEDFCRNTWGRGTPV